MKTFILILSCFFFFQRDNHIEKISIFLYGEGEMLGAVPKRYKPYLTKKQIKEFEQGVKVRDRNPFKVYYITYYHDLSVDNIVKTSEGYRQADSEVGMLKTYYSSGKIREKKNYVVVNDKTKEIISIEEFTKINNKNKGEYCGYEGMPHGTWKYYSEEGQLVKEENYDKGVLIKTTIYKE